MADQVAIALDNARLFTESQQALEATRRAYGQLSREAWTELLSGRADWGYVLAHQSFVPVQGDWQPEMVQALQSGRVVVRGPEPNVTEKPSARKTGDGERGPMLALPLKVRDDVIGALSFNKDPAGAAWTDDEMELLQRLVDQLGAALESAQLFQETQRRAAREQAIRYVTEGMRRSVDMETILQNTLVELARALGVPRAYVRLGTEAELLDALRAQEPHNSRGGMDGQDQASHG
jgi:GAF domain-containing protein